MESYPKLTVVQSDSKKILISFLYSTACAINILIDDTISLFVEGTTEALACVNVGNPSGHWSQGNFKVGQVTLDISAVTFHNKRYNLCYVSQDTVRSSLALSWRPADGALTEYREQNNEQEPATSPAIQDYTYVSGISSDTSSFECSRMLSHTSSSFVVVNESDSKPQEPDIENGTDDFQSQPDDFEGFPDPVNSRSYPGNIESEPWIQLPGTPSEVLSKVEDFDTEVLSTVSKTAQKSDSSDANLTRSDIPPDMSASVNWDDRVVSQKEVQLLRSNKRDLHQKIKTLTKIMEKMQKELVVFREKPGDSETTEKIRRLESEVKQHKQEIDGLGFKIAKLKEENHILKKKNAQLTIEKNTQFERSTTLLNELQDKEKENEVLRSENMVLQGKLKRLEGNERKKKRQPRHEEHEQRRDKVDPIENPVKLTPRKTPIESGHKTEPPTSRPSDLPLTGGAKLKPTPPPQIIPHERRQAPEGRKTHQPPMDKQPTRQPFMRSSQQKPETQKRGDPVRNSKPFHSDQRASDMTIQSEPRVGEIANSLRGTSSIKCPVCQKSLYAREDEYSVLLHVEQCLQST